MHSHLISGDIVALHTYRVIYFAIPKVANSTMKAICAELIRDELDQRFVEEFWRDRWKPRIFRHSEARNYLRKKGVLLCRQRLAKYDSYWKFCVVRNPWDRLVSCWKQKISALDSSDRSELNGVAQNLADLGLFHHNMDFEQFVRVVSRIDDVDANRHFRSQHTFVCDENGELIVDYVGRMERLDREVEKICRKMGISGPEVPHLLKGGGKPYPEYYNQETRSLVSERFAHDIHLFNYAFDDKAAAQA